MQSKVIDSKVRKILGALAFLGIALSVGSWLINRYLCNSNTEWLGGWLQNMSTELLGAIITFALFDLILGKREKKEDEMRKWRELQANSLTRLKTAYTDDEKQAIIQEMDALDLLREANLRNIDLKGLYLSNLNLGGADLSWAILTGADLSNTNLQDTFLIEADLSNCDLTGANLQRAKIIQTTLSNALIKYADLSYTIVQHSILQGANLKGAITRGVKLSDNTMDVNTVLSDGSKWNEHVDRLSL